LIHLAKTDVRGELLTFYGNSFGIDGTGADGALDNLFRENVYRIKTD
jgi:hypothetical protein